MTTGLPPLALIAGPTASGKSDLAVRLALALQAQGREGVVINADSAQVYADLARATGGTILNLCQPLAASATVNTVGNRECVEFFAVPESILASHRKG